MRTQDSVGGSWTSPAALALRCFMPDRRFRVILLVAASRGGSHLAMGVFHALAGRRRLDAESAATTTDRRRPLDERRRDASSLARSSARRASASCWLIANRREGLNTVAGQVAVYVLLVGAALTRWTSRHRSTGPCPSPAAALPPGPRSASRRSPTSRWRLRRCAGRRGQRESSQSCPIWHPDVLRA